MTIAMFSIHISAMPLSLSHFDFFWIYKADSSGSRTYPFRRSCFSALLHGATGELLSLIVATSLENLSPISFMNLLVCWYIIIYVCSSLFSFEKYMTAYELEKKGTTKRKSDRAKKGAERRGWGTPCLAFENWTFPGLLPLPLIHCPFIIWAGPWENVSYVICKQQRRRSACAST